MAKGRTVEHTTCSCGKRGFATEELAFKALGRAQSRHRRAPGGGRGGRMENRVYLCGHEEVYHLTSESQRQHNRRAVAA